VEGPAETARLWLDAGAKADVDALVNMGNNYASGRGVPRDYSEAWKWYRVAAEQGDTQAQEILGKMYLEGNEVPQDSEKAAKWSRKAAERVNAAMKEMKRNAAVILPVPIGDITPPYTEQARAAGISGTVTVHCVVHLDGTADECKIQEGLGYGLDESAIRTIEKQGRFKPATIRGNPVEMRAPFKIEFWIDQWVPAISCFYTLFLRRKLLIAIGLLPIA
jgi:TonB family protein